MLSAMVDEAAAAEEIVEELSSGFYTLAWVEAKGVAVEHGWIEEAGRPGQTCLRDL